MFLSPVLVRYFYGQNTSYFGEMVIVSFSAQAFCVPISVFYFGDFSIIGIMANIIVTPLIPPIMALTFISGVAPAITPIAFVCKMLLTCQIFAVNNLSKIWWAVMSVGSGNGLVFLAYVPVILLTYCLKRCTKYSYRPQYDLDKTPEYGKIYSC